MLTYSKLFKGLQNAPLKLASPISGQKRGLYVRSVNLINLQNVDFIPQHIEIHQSERFFSKETLVYILTISLSYVQIVMI